MIFTFANGNYFMISLRAMTFASCDGILYLSIDFLLKKFRNSCYISFNYVYSRLYSL